jgi:hypothetical protein
MAQVSVMPSVTQGLSKTDAEGTPIVSDIRRMPPEEMKEILTRLVVSCRVKVHALSQNKTNSNGEIKQH